MTPGERSTLGELEWHLRRCLLRAGGALSPDARLLLQLIVDLELERDPVPDQRTLASMLNMGERRLATARQQLQSLGFVVVQRAGRHPATWTLNVDCLFRWTQAIEIEAGLGSTGVDSTPPGRTSIRRSAGSKRGALSIAAAAPPAAAAPGRAASAATAAPRSSRSASQAQPGEADPPPGEPEAIAALEEVFGRLAAPLRRIVGRWLENGLSSEEIVSIATDAAAHGARTFAYAEAIAERLLQEHATEAVVAEGLISFEAHRRRSS
jgi:hypothetical protein